MVTLLLLYLSKHGSSMLLSKYGISVSILILLEYLIDVGCVHAPLVNFSYRRVNHLLEY